MAEEACTEKFRYRVLRATSVRRSKRRFLCAFFVMRVSGAVWFVIRADAHSSETGSLSRL